HAPSDPAGFLSRVSGTRHFLRRSPRIAGGGHRLALFLHQSPPRRILPHSGIRFRFRRAQTTHWNVSPQITLTAVLRMLPSEPMRSFYIFSWREPAPVE